MTVFEAVNKMRQMTKDRQPFSFSFMSYNRDKQTSEGMVQVENAKLIDKKTNTPEDDLRERYFDYDKAGIRTFYIGSLMTFQGKKLIIK